MKIVLLSAATTLLLSCASTPTAVSQAPADPLQPVNRAVHRFNGGIDRFILRPVAQGYRQAVPGGMRYVIGNFFEHWTYPPVILNDLLQGKLRQAGRDSARFALNTVMGIGGLFDVAEENGLPPNDEDFGQTLAVWGVPAGPYLVLPLLGPSTLRDALGRPLDVAVSPYYRKVDDEEWEALHGLLAIDTRAGLLDSDDLYRESYDAYLFLRDAWLQRRNFLIFDGEPPIQDPADSADDLDYEIELD